MGKMETVVCNVDRALVRFRESPRCSSQSWWQVPHDCHCPVVFPFVLASFQKRLPGGGSVGGCGLHGGGGQRSVSTGSGAYGHVQHRPGAGAQGSLEEGGKGGEEIRELGPWG